MKLSSCYALPLLAAALFFLTACNSSEDTATDASATMDSVAEGTADATMAATNTIVTTPQGMVMAKFKVKNYAAWKAVYDQRESLRLASGVHNYVISRVANDSNTIITAFKVDDMAKAKAYLKDPSTTTAMQGAGMMGTPSIRYINTSFQDTAVLAPGVLRTMTTFNIKDWADWEKNFKDGEQERIDNGLAVRLYGHDADDTKKVVIVTALMDTAKAYAYWKSDMLKKRMDAGGITSQPERVVFQIVQRY